MTEEIQNKVSHITQILADFGFKGVRFEGVDRILKSDTFCVNFILTGEHVKGVRFTRGFYNYEEFLDVPTHYIISDILHSVLKTKLGE